MATYSQGTKYLGGPTVSGTPSDYRWWDDAFNDIVFPLTGDVTLIQLRAVNMGLRSMPQLAGDLGGHKLTIKSAVPHRGRPDGGVVTTFSTLGGDGFNLFLGNGSVEIQDMDLRPGGDDWFHLIVVTNDNTLGDLDVEIHDVVMDGNGHDLRDSSSTNVAFRIDYNAPGGVTASAKIWNTVVNVTDANGAGVNDQQTARFRTTGAGSVPFDVDNSIFRIDGSNAATAYAVHTLTQASQETVTLNNVVAIQSGSAIAAFTVDQTVGYWEQHSCAADDASADDADVVTNAHNNIVVANEFDSILRNSFGSYFVPSAGGVLAGGGEAPVIAANTSGIKGRARPRGSLYSVGPVEGVCPAFSSGSHNIGDGETYNTLSTAFAALNPSLTGNVTLILSSDVTEDAPILVDQFWASIELNGYTFRITSDSPHFGVASQGHVLTFSVDWDNEQFAPFIDTLGTLEIDNLNIRLNREYYKGFLLDPYNANMKIHDILFIGDQAYGAQDYPVFLNAGDGLVEVWNVIFNVWHHATRRGSDTRTQSVLIDVYGTGQVIMENVTVITRSNTPHLWSNGIDGISWYTPGSVADELVCRNVYAAPLAGTPHQDYYNNGASAGSTIDHSASDDGTADTQFATEIEVYTGVDLTTSTMSLDPTNAAFFAVPYSENDLENGTAPQISGNTAGIRKIPRDGTAIGAVEVPIPAVGEGWSVTNFIADPTIEGPQILLRWSLPSDTDTISFRVLKKEKNYSEDETDGTLLVDALITAGTTSYVDLGPIIDTAWCYSAFVFHACTTLWAANSLVERGDTVGSLSTAFFYESNGRGLSGSIEPTWPTIIGSTVQDGDITWTCISANPGWVVRERSRDSAFTWDSEYMQRLLFQVPPPAYRNADAKSNLVRLSPQQDPDDFNVWRALHEDGTVQRGEFERFLMIFGSLLSRVRGASDFYPRLVDASDTLPQLLPFLAGILGWELDTTQRTAAQRQALLSAVPIYKIKGTVRSLESLLRQIVGVDDSFVDPMSHHIMMSNRTTRLSAQGQVAGTYDTWVTATGYARGDIVIPTGSNRTGFYYQARNAGTSAGGEPTWPTVSGDDVVDNDIVWRTVQFGVPHLTADVSAGGVSLTVDDTSPFEAGRTINVRDTTTPAGEEIIILAIPDPTTLTLDGALVNAYTLADNAVVSPAFDWYDDETGFIWDIPVIDQFDGIDPDRVRVPGAVIDPSDLYSFEILRIWVILEAGESVSTAELEALDKLMTQFAPADTSYVVRIEGP